MPSSYRAFGSASVNNLLRAVLLTIRVEPSAVAATPFRLRPVDENAAAGQLSGMVMA
jgi:hypothetical protein